MYRKHLRMARGEGEAQDSVIWSHFVERVVKLPMVHVAWDYATSTYTHLKESNKLVNFTLTNAEKSVNFVAEQAKPVVRRFEKQIQAVDTLACKGLGTLEEKVPIITKPPQQIIGETRKLYSDTVSSRIEGIRNYGNGKVKSVADYSLQKASDIFGNHLVQSVVTSVDGALDITEHLLDVVRPPVDGEQQNDVNSTTDDKEKKSILSRVGDLSSKLRHRAKKRLSERIETLQGKALDFVIYPLVLAQNAKENLEAAQNYAKALWELLNKEDKHGIVIKPALLGVRLLVIAIDLLSRLLSRRHLESTESTSQDSTHSSKGVNVKENILWAIGMIPLVPSIIAMYCGSVFSSAITHSPAVVSVVKDSVLWGIGMLRMMPSAMLLYSYVFLSWLSKKDSPKDEVDGILYTEDDKNKEENCIQESNGDTQQVQQ